MRGTRLGLAVVLVLALFASGSAFAAVRHVHNHHDHGPGSLRNAIAAASAGDVVKVPKGRYELKTGELLLDEGIQIKGAGASKTILDANGKSRVLELAVTADPVKVSGLTITGGRAANGGAVLNLGNLTLSRVDLKANVAAGDNLNVGGGIATSGALKLNRVLMSKNRTSGAAEGFGGAIGAPAFPGAAAVGPITIDRSRFIHNAAPTDGFGGAMMVQPSNFSAGASVTITRTTFAHNRAIGGSNFSGDGGALMFNPYVSMPVGYGLVLRGDTFSDNVASTAGGGRGFGGAAAISPRAQVAGADVSVAITNTTFTGNAAGSPGASGQGLGGAINSDLSATSGGTVSERLVNVTIAANSARGDLGAGGGIYSSGTTETAHFLNSIVSGNTAAGGSGCYGTVVSEGHNIDREAGCGFVMTGDLPNTNPLLGKLRDNGGPTQTMALSKHSPARNAGDDLGCPGTDQRGVRRPQGAHCDIGAFEYKP